MTLTAVTADFHQPFDIHLNFAAKVAFDREVFRDIFAEKILVVIRQFANARIRVDARFR